MGTGDGSGSVVVGRVQQGDWPDRHSRAMVAGPTSPKHATDSEREVTTPATTSGATTESPSTDLSRPKAFSARDKRQEVGSSAMAVGDFASSELAGLISGSMNHRPPFDMSEAGGKVSSVGVDDERRVKQQHSERRQKRNGKRAVLKEDRVDRGVESLGDDGGRRRDRSREGTSGEIRIPSAERRWVN
jgi:hypothetical protein